MEETDLAAIGRLKADIRSGASELLPQVIAILRQGIRGGRAAEVACETVAAQPSMAPPWNAALAALEDPTGAALDRFEQRSRRAGAAMTRVAVEALQPAAGRRLHIITCSFSGSVLACVRALARATCAAPAASQGARGDRRGTAPLRVSCAEGRPALEGRRMADALSREVVPVDFYTDGAIAGALGADGLEDRVVLVGADAVSPAWVINKVGTGMLAAAAARASVPVFVAATRDKFVDARVASRLAIVEQDGREVWDGAPGGVAVRNRYFERVPIDLLTGIITDAGVLAAGMIAEACRAASARSGDADIARLAVPGNEM